MKRASLALLLLPLACQAYLPAWSPDGKSIAFVHPPLSPTQEVELYVVTLGKDEPPRLVERGGILASWAEDGSLYYLCKGEEPDRRTLVRLAPEGEGKGERELVLDPPEYSVEWYALSEKGVYCILGPGGKLLYYDPEKEEFLQASTAEGCAWACLHPGGKILAAYVKKEKEARVLLLTDGNERHLGKLKPGPVPAMTFFERGVLVAAEGGIKHLPFSGKGGRFYGAPGRGHVIALGLSPSGEAIVSLRKEAKEGEKRTGTDVLLYAFSKGKWKKLAETWGRTYDPAGNLFAEYTEAGLHVASTDLSQHAYFPVRPGQELNAVSAHEKAGRLDAALAQAERALSRPNPYSARIELARMRIHLRLKDPRQAARAFLRAYLVHPVSELTEKDWDGGFKRVSALTDRLIEELSTARRARPSRAAELLDRAQALEADPDMLAGLAFRTGLSLFRAKLHVRAARRFRLAWDVDTFPQRGHAAVMQAVSYFFAGKTALAAETLARASAMLPENPLAPQFERLRRHLLHEGQRRKWTVEAKGTPYSARVTTRPALELEPEKIWVRFERTSSILREGKLFFGPVKGEVGRLTVSPDGKRLAFLKRSGTEEAWEKACVVSEGGKKLVEEGREGLLDCSWKDARRLLLTLAGGEEETLSVPPAE